MAVFEKKVARRIRIDDTEVLTCTIENYQNIHGHTEYIIRVQRGPLQERSWVVQKRYNDFTVLHNALQQSGISLPLPPKKLIGNMDRDFVAERLRGLQNYLNIILMNPILASSLPLKKFLDPENYSTPFQELALQNVSMALRGVVNYEIVKPVPEIGWRIRKHYFLVKNHSLPKDEMILSWVEYGPDKYLEERDLSSVFKGVAGIQHPYIQRPNFISCNEIGGYAVRVLNSIGTLRDIICLSKPKLPFLKKYGNPKQHKCFPVNEVAMYGKQILEALCFVHSKGLPYGHLHTGNILIDDGSVKLLDIENGVLGLPSFYRPYFLQHRKIRTLESVDVYCFGHVLFEMVFGTPLHESVCDSFPSDCPQLIKSLLESILSTEACKAGMPSLSDILAHPFFSNSSLSDAVVSGQPYLKFSSHVRDSLKEARLKMEERLKDEQKLVRQQKRMAKVQELLISDGDKKTRKSKMKVQDQWASQQQLVPNGKSPERSESPNSTSTATSVGTVTPPSGATDVSAELPNLAQFTTLSSTASGSDNRSALLGSICSFNKSTLRHIKT